jgi:large conductance mechanosensitive channel
MNLREVFFGEFKTFVTKGNVIDLAVGVLIGAAFGDVVKSFTTGIVTPLINLFGGGAKVSLHLWIFDVGLVLNSLITFLITAMVLFFVFVKPMNKLKEITARKEEAAPPPPPPEDVVLLREIRDLLKAQEKATVAAPSPTPLS